MKQVLEIIKIEEFNFLIGINEFYHQDMSNQDKYAYKLPNGEIYTHPTVEGCLKMIHKHYEYWLFNGKWPGL